MLRMVLIWCQFMQMRRWSSYEALLEIVIIGLGLNGRKMNINGQMVAGSTTKNGTQESLMGLGQKTVFTLTGVSNGMTMHADTPNATSARKV